MGSRHTHQLVHLPHSPAFFFQSLSSQVLPLKPGGAPAPLPRGQGVWAPGPSLVDPSFKELPPEAAVCAPAFEKPEVGSFQIPIQPQSSSGIY